ncbi:MAG: DUF4255 domain-containing protein [Bacillota bacterium]
MALYTVIADTSETILELLRKHMVPDVLQNKEDIGICRPDDRGTATLGIQLYHIEQNQEIKNQGRVMLDDEHFMNPPSSMHLNYMVFVRSDSAVATRSIDEQRILGRAIQVLDDNGRVKQEDLKGVLAMGENRLDMQNLVLPFEEASKIYTLFDRTFVLGVFYKVGPVFLDMAEVRRVTRVTSADISVEMKQKKRSGF